MTLTDDLDPLGHLGAVQHLIEQLRLMQRVQAPVVGHTIGAYGVAYRRFRTEGRPPDTPSGEVILFGIDAAGREFAMRYVPDEAEALIAKLRGQTNLARGLPEEGLRATELQNQIRMIGETVMQLTQTVQVLPVDAGYFEILADGRQFEILVRPKRPPGEPSSEPPAPTDTPMK